MPRRPMIFDTDGTGFYKRAVRQMMAQKEIPYLSGLGGGAGLGDEIMLLSGLDDVGAMYPHGYDDGPARTYTLPSPDRRTDYDFPSGPVDLGMSGTRLGQPLSDLGAGWPKQTRHHQYRYTGFGKLSAGWPAEQKQHSYRYTGLGAGWPAEQKKHSYRYTGLGAPASAFAAAAAAEAAHVACVAGCAIVGAPCTVACDLAYNEAQAAIQSPSCDADCQRQKILAIDAVPAAHGAPPSTRTRSSSGSSSSSSTDMTQAAPPDDSGPSMLPLALAAAGAVALGFMWWSDKKDRQRYGR